MARTVRKRGEGRQALIAAALLEFEEHGFDSTNSNAIARRAGYAPQTFYRHFNDKLEIFIAAYRAWSEAGLEDAAAATNADAYAHSLVEHHRTHRIFRRSLRLLTVSDPRVMAARTEARVLQMAAMAARNPRFTMKAPASQLGALLTIERLCDAIADEEFAACQVTHEAAIAELVTLLRSV